MSQNKTISGFSKLSKRGKIKWIVENFFKDPENVMRELSSYMLEDEDHQRILDEISENTISNYHLPYGVAPNFVINRKTYCVPMVTEESSVVAAASSGAKFWMSRGGIKAEIIDTVKLGQVHFFFTEDPVVLHEGFEDLKSALLQGTEEISVNMRKRGGGITDIELRDFTHEMDNYYQLFVSFETCDSMGANFINSVLEKFAEILIDFFPQGSTDVLMSILSNYTPDCVVRAEVSCPIAELGMFKGGLSAEEFALRFWQGVKAAHVDPYRAVTHNKGIFNGIDSVVIATGNDFRAIESSGHAYAAKDGSYRSLSHCTIDNGIFRFWLEVPMAVGSVGGLTTLHPIAKRSFELLDLPSARELMAIIASTGLAQNFAALRSLVTTGIQEGHMRMHLSNILKQLDATAEEVKSAKMYFEDHTVSYGAVRDYLYRQRGRIVPQED